MARGAQTIVPSAPLKSHHRKIAIAFSAAAHLALLTWMMRPAEPSATMSAVEVMSVSLASTVNGAAPPASSWRASDTPPQPPPPPPTDIEPQFIEVATSASPERRDPDNDPLSDAIRAAASSAEGQPCQLAAWLQQALMRDPQVTAALREIPRPARSVANAMMFWDGAWVEPPAASKEGVTMIRAALVVGVRAAPAACQAQDISGPEMMTLVIGADTTVIVIGSGQWRWADLLTSQLAG